VVTLLPTDLSSFYQVIAAVMLSSFFAGGLQELYKRFLKGAFGNA
jgi:hypothetical protein